MTYSLFTSRLFLVVNSRQRRELVCLLDIIERNDVMAFDYPIALMNVFARFLATGLLEATFSNAGIRFDKSAWNQLVESHAWPKQALAAINNPPEGFDLVGDVAFLQMPNEIFEEKEFKSVDQLLQPFIVSGETTKGLRQDGENIQSICKSCGLIGLYAQHFHTAAISQYWSTSIVNGAQLFSPVAISQPLRTTLAMHLISKPMYERELGNKHLGHDQFLTMPWVPKNSRIQFDQTQLLPFEQWLNPEQQRGHICDLWLPLIRALRLRTHFVESACNCDLCGQNIENGDLVVDGFYLKTEAEIFKNLDADTRKSYQMDTVAYEAQFASKDEGKDKKDKTTNVFNFKRLYQQQLRHPLVAYKPNKLSEDKDRVLAPGFQNNINSRRPNWADLLKAKDKNKPVLLKQLGYIENRNAINGVDLVGLGYKKGRDIDCLTHQFFSFSQLASVLQLTEVCSNEEFVESLQKNTQTVSDIFDQFIKKPKTQQPTTQDQEEIEQASQSIEQQKAHLKNAPDLIFQKQKLIDNIEAFQQDIQHLHTLSGSDVDTARKSQKNVKNLVALHKVFMSQHAHYAMDHISHTERVINALLEAGKMLEKKVEPDYQKKNYTLKKEKRTDNRLSRAPQFMNMVTKLWQTTLRNLIDIAGIKESEDREDRLFECKREITQQGEKLLNDYLNANPLVAPELAARYLECKAIAEYRKKAR